MGEFSFDNVMTADDAFGLFDDVSTGGEENKEKPSQNNDTTITEEPSNPFEDDTTPESVGDEQHKRESEVLEPKGNSSSSQNNFSSIASALKEYGTFEDLSDEDIAKIVDGQTLIEAIDKQARAKFDERQKRVDDALNSGMEPSLIQQYENVLNNLDNIQEETLKDEGDTGSNLRKSLIYQDFINRGYSKERAEKEVKKSFDAGTDVEDALDALESNKEFYTEKYNSMVKENNEKLESLQKEKEKQAATLKASILEDEKAFNELVIDKYTRQKIYDSITKPVYRDPQTKQQYTAIQKYALDNPTEFQKNLGLVFTMTNGFKDFAGLIKGPVKKEVKAKIAQMEQVIKNSRSSNGDTSLFGSPVDNDASFPSWRIDM